MEPSYGEPGWSSTALGKLCCLSLEICGCGVKFVDTSCVCANCVVLTISLRSPSAVSVNAVTNIYSLAARAPFRPAQSWMFQPDDVPCNTSSVAELWDVTFDRFREIIEPLSRIFIYIFMWPKYVEDMFFIIPHSWGTFLNYWNTTVQMKENCINNNIFMHVDPVRMLQQTLVTGGGANR